MNIERLRKVGKWIVDNHEHFDMREGINNENPEKFCVITEKGGLKTFKGFCGTTACIGGIAALMSHSVSGVAPPKDSLSWAEVEFAASDYLDLDEKQAINLFYTPISPNSHSLVDDKESFNGDSLAYAKAAQKRIEDFIEKYNN